MQDQHKVGLQVGRIPVRSADILNDSWRYPCMPAMKIVVVLNMVQSSLLPVYPRHCIARNIGSQLMSPCSAQM